MADWGLQAVIRPKEYDEDHPYSTNDNNHQHQYQEHDDCFGSIDMKKEYDQAFLFCFPHLFDHHDHVHATTSTMDTVAAGDELDQLYKPFYPACVSQSQFPASADLQSTKHHHLHHHHHHLHDSDREAQQDQEQEIQNFCGSASNTSKVAPKLKKRKNQQKRVVVQVTADGLSSDPWAWRKYGQKPIKGSIYPRSYYRCSSSKGCLARRQVEQSCTDSSIYILTYTAEHNHPQPTRRNSLAGINRNKFKATTPKSPTNSDEGKTITKSKDSPFHSPTSASSTEEEILSQSIVKQETMFYNKCDNQGHMMMAGGNDDDYMVFSDDFFAGLEDLGGYIMEPSSYNLSSEQMPSVFS